MTDLRTQLADTIAALIDPYEHVETYEQELPLRSPVPGGGPTRIVKTKRVHRVKFPSLLDQLATAIEPSSSSVDGARAGYASKPSARLDAIDRLNTIASEAKEWIAHARLTPRGDTAGNLRALIAADMHDCCMRQLHAAARRWLTWGRIVTGWEQPPRTLKEPCMICGIRGRIRVRLDPNQATCLDCGSVWQEDDGTFRMLVEYVRYCNDEPEESAA